MSKRLLALQAERDKVRSAMTALEDGTVGADGVARDLSPDEEQARADLVARDEELCRSIEQLHEQQSRNARVAELVRDITPADDSTRRVRVGDEPAPVTVGEYASLYVRAFAYHEQAARDELTRVLTLMRQVDDTITTDVAGIIPTPVVGDLIKFVDANRYVVNSMRELPMPPSGMSFTRPRATQRTTSGAQSAQLAELTSQHMAITGDTVTVGMRGGAALLSAQVIERSDPSLLQIIFEDLAEAYAIDTEGVACAAIEAAITTNTTSLESNAAADAFFLAMAQAAKTVYAAAKRLPDTLYAGVNRWAYLVGLVDADDRQIFPNLSPVNAAGATIDVTSFAGNPLGLRLVVSPEFDDDFFAVAAARYLEKFEQRRGLATLSTPSTLSTEASYSGYFATNVRPEGLCALEDTTS